MTNISNQNKVPYQGQIQRKKELKDLNMMDAFLFDALTEKPEDAKVIARTIVRRVLGHDLDSSLRPVWRRPYALYSQKYGGRKQGTGI